jgi:hypothetical protein
MKWPKRTKDANGANQRNKKSYYFYIAKSPAVFGEAELGVQA